MGVIFWGMIFGSIGFGYIIYGRRQGKAVPLISGIILCVFPYFLPDTTLIILFGILFSALPFFISG